MDYKDELDDDKDQKREETREEKEDGVETQGLQEDDQPQVESMHPSRSRHSSRPRTNTSRLRSRSGRRNSPHTHPIVSYLDDHSSYVHEHTSNHSDSESAPESAEEARQKYDETQLDSQENYGSEEKDVEEVLEVRDGTLDIRDVESGLPLARKSSSKSNKDPNLVTWEGTDDPRNPKNWSTKRKWAATIVISSFTFISPVSSSMVAPALGTIAADLKIGNAVESQLVLSIFILAYSIGPLFLGPLSELYGRVIVLQISNAFYFIFNMACGFAQTPGQMLAFRFLSGLGGSAPLSIGGGVLGDCWLAHERGQAIAIYSLMPLLGPAVGPIAGGFITENTTWRWAFWATCIADAAIQCSGLFFLQETYAPEILKRKKDRLVKETGNTKLHTEFEHPERSFINHTRTALVRPFRLLFTQPIIQVLAIYIAYIYGIMYLVLSTFPGLWTAPQYYDESIGIGGLNYISLGLGFFLGTQICAPINDRLYRRLKKRNNNVGRPEFRIPLMVPGSLLVPVGLFWYGWTAETHCHWILPNIGAAIFAAGGIMAFQCCQTYIVDAYTRYAASAIAATTVLRSLCGFGFPLFAPYLYGALKYGWGNSLLGFIALGLGVPAPILLWKYGERLRAKSTFAVGE